MLNTLRKHWYFSALTTGAIAAAAYCLFFPPAIVMTIALILKSAPLFVALGTFAATAALSTVAATAALAIFTLGAVAHAIVSTLAWAARGVLSLFNSRKGPAHDGDDDRSIVITESYQQVSAFAPRLTGAPRTYAEMYPDPTPSTSNLTQTQRGRPSSAFFPDRNLTQQDTAIAFAAGPRP